MAHMTPSYYDGQWVRVKACWDAKCSFYVPKADYIEGLGFIVGSGDGILARLASLDDDECTPWKLYMTVEGARRAFTEKGVDPVTGDEITAPDVVDRMFTGAIPSVPLDGPYVAVLGGHRVWGVSSAYAASAATALYPSRAIAEKKTARVWNARWQEGYIAAVRDIQARA